MQNDSYNRGGYIAFLFSMFFSLGFFLYVIGFHPGVDLKEVTPTAPEQVVAGGEAAKAVDVTQIEKPWVESEDMIKHGAKVYASACAVCHGPTGAGDGPAGRALVPPPRNFIEGGWKQGGDSIGLFETIRKGIPGTSMAAFGHLPVVDRWAMVQFIRSITKDKVGDDPAKLEEFAKTAQ